jgi:uncharacterized membrane protein
MLVSVAQLSGFQNRLCYGLWQLDGNKILGRIEVILAALINDPNVSVHGGIIVREKSIDLM